MSGREPSGSSGDGLGLWGRLLHGSEGLTVGERFRKAVLKPTSEEETAPPEPDTRSLDELRSAERFADDRERFLGLIAAPLAAAVGFLIANYLVEHDPVAYLKNGQPNPLHASVGTYHTLELVLLVLAALMLAFAWYRRRLFLGMAMALYGLGVFNLHYWGFGVPFLLGGAWVLVHAYRAHQAVRQAAGEGRPRGDGRLSRPKPSKRYTPPT